MNENKVKVNLEGREVELDIIDIITYPATEQEILIYNIQGLEDDNIYSSLIIEKEDEISLEEIDDPEMIAFVEEALLEMFETDKTDI